MASEQENRIVAEVMDNMKMAETEESSARRYVRRAVDKILIYCCREDLPERLEGTAAQIAEDMLKADLLVSTGKETSSVTRGDTTISYRDSSASRSATVDFMKNYETSGIHLKSIMWAKSSMTMTTSRCLWQPSALTIRSFLGMSWIAVMTIPYL